MKLSGKIEKSILYVKIIMMDLHIITKFRFNIQTSYLLLNKIEKLEIMLKCKIICVFFLLISNIFFAQEKSFFNESRELIEGIINKNQILADKDLIAYSIANSQIVIIVNNKDFDTFLFKKNQKKIEYYKNYKPNKNKHKTIKNFFENRNKCPQESNSNFEVGLGNPTYFVMKYKNQSFCEFQLNVYMESLPFDKNLYYYLTQIVLDDFF